MTRVKRGARGRFLLAALVAAACALTGVAAATDSSNAAHAQNYTVSTVLLGQQQIIGGLYQPITPNKHTSTGLFLTHENSDFIGSVPCVQLAQRGFTVLCAKSEYAEQAVAHWDNLAHDVGAGVGYLRGLDSVHKVVLVGWSGGGAIMSYYQNVADHGVSVCQDPARLDPCGDELAGLPPADGVVLLDSIPGIAFSDLTAWDASVTSEKNLRVRNKSLDMYSAANGYAGRASSDYSAAFVQRYLKGQAAREARLVAQAQKMTAQIANGNGQYTDDAPMPVGRDAARIWQADSSLISHTVGKYPLISPQHPTGGAPQVVSSLRVPSASADDNASWAGSGNDFTASSFESIAAIRAPKLAITDDSITGVDWASTNTATVNNVRGITSPLLVMSMTGHYWLVPSEMYYDAATSAKSRTLVFVKGATHGFTPCTACATTLNEFGDTVKETFDYVTNWIVGHQL